ncbi:hypothetical protein ACNKHV_20800 [Shigella flexneri]
MSKPSRRSALPRVAVGCGVSIRGYILCCVYEHGQRRLSLITLNVSKAAVFTQHKVHLTVKVNMAGVIPAIFASSIILFPATIASSFGGGTGWDWLTTISMYLQPGQPLYVLLMHLQSSSSVSSIRRWFSTRGNSR